MKIAFCSDLHLELAELKLLNTPTADVLVLAGDIFIANDLKQGRYNWAADNATRYVNFIAECCRLYRDVIFIMGNHEHYHGVFNKTAKIIEKTFCDFDNFHFLNKRSIVINNVVFVGGTLWTDINQGDPESIYTVREGLNDYEEILFQDQIETRKLDPKNTIADFYQTFDFIKTTVKEDKTKQFVVITHHAPSKRSQHPNSDTEDLLNAGYQSDLDIFIEQHPQIKLWIHGHTHQRQNYCIGNTQIVCNPRGYLGMEHIAYNFELSVVENDFNNNGDITNE